MSSSPISPTAAAEFASGRTTVPRPPLWTLTFVTFLSINLFVFMGFNMLLPTLSLYLDGMGCTKEQIGLIFSSFAAASIVSRLSAAGLSRRFGALRIVKCGLAICSIGTFLFFIHPWIPLYAAARMLHGAGFGLTSTLMVSMAAQVIPARRLGEGLGYLGLGATTALALGPMAGLWISRSLGFPAMFVSIASCYVVGALISLSLPKIRLASDLVAVRPKGLSAVIDPRALPTAGLAFLYGSAGSAISVYLAIYCQEHSLPSAASFFVISTIGTVTARLTAGRVYDRYGARMVVPPALLLLIIPMAIILARPAPAFMYAAAVIYGLGQGALFPALQTLTLSSVPSDRRTMASAAFFVAFDLGIGLGTISLGLLAGRVGDYAIVYKAAPGYLVLTLIWFLILDARRRRRRTVLGKSGKSADGRCES